MYKSQFQKFTAMIVTLKTQINLWFIKPFLNTVLNENLSLFRTGFWFRIITTEQHCSILL